jgi:hypothetical protein
MAQVGIHLPSMGEALGFNPQYYNKKKKTYKTSPGSHQKVTTRIQVFTPLPMCLLPPRSSFILKHAYYIFQMGLFCRGYCSGGF